jgi:hypothetical protein
MATYDFITPVNIHKGQRWSTARGYLRRRVADASALPEIPRANTTRRRS